MEYLTTDTELQTVANAIRTKGGTLAPLSYPAGFADAISAIASDCTATAGDIKTGKTAWVGNQKITGNMSGKSAATYNTSASDQTISGEQYLSGDQTIKGVTTSNIDAGNIKTGVTITVGDVNDSTRIKNVTGTFTSDGTAAAGHILSGKVAYVNGNKITGSISSRGATTYNTSSSDQSIPAGLYLSGAQTIKAVTTSNIDAGNIKKGVTITVGDGNSSTRIKNVTGTYTSDANAAASDMLSGKIGYVNGNKITGTIASQAATTYNVSTSDQTIAAGKYLSGAQTIRKVTTANISAGNIKRGVTIQVGDSGSATRIANVTGTCPAFAMMGSTQVPIIFRRTQSWGGWYYQGQSSSYAAESTVGYYSIYWYTTSDYKEFVVPAKVTFTFFAGRDRSSTSTITLNPNTWYAFKGTTSSGYDVFDLYQGSTLLTSFFKIVSWVFV